MNDLCLHHADYPAVCLAAYLENLGVNLFLLLVVEAYHLYGQVAWKPTDATLKHKYTHSVVGWMNCYMDVHRFASYFM